MGPAGFVAVVCGWIVAEVGRQPYVVYGYLRTADAVSPVPAGHVATSLIAFMLAYAVVFTAGVALHPAADGGRALRRRTRRPPSPPARPSLAAPGQDRETPHEPRPAADLRPA